jgi:branched-chain amino acid transport system ATP-binding protein
MTLLSVSNLQKSFGSVKAVDGVSFDLAAGQLLALIGPNGAGKSTCFNMLNGQLKPTSGSIVFDGQEIAGKAPRDIWRMGAGRTFQIAATFNSMTVVENVQMALISSGRQLFNVWKKASSLHVDEAMHLLDQVGMLGHAQRACGVLAYGDIKRVELAIALANKPKLLLMDEPTAGMAPAERHDLMALIRRLVVSNKLGVLFTEHSMDVVFAYADTLMVLARGKLIAHGDPETVRNDLHVQEVYFGTSKTFSPHTPGGFRAKDVSP